MIFCIYIFLDTIIHAERVNTTFEVRLMKFIRSFDKLRCFLFQILIRKGKDFLGKGVQYFLIQ